MTTAGFGQADSSASALDIPPGIVRVDAVTPSPQKVKARALEGQRFMDKQVKRMGGTVNGKGKDYFAG
jgi:hypothetical protein